MKKITITFGFILSLFVSNTVLAQTIAMDFEGEDCNANQVHLFSDLDAGKAVILFYYMPNCAPCPEKALEIQSMANAINAVYPGSVKGYAYPYQNTTDCAYSANWVTSNGLQDLFIPMDSGAVQVAYYGGFGMPTVVLVGGSNHEVIWSTQDYSSSDTITMHDSIVALLGVADVPVVAAEPSLKLYPNPSQEQLNILLPSDEKDLYSFSLLDIEGRERTVAEFFSANNDKTISLNTSELPNGVYFLKVNYSGNESLHKITVLH